MTMNKRDYSYCCKDPIGFAELSKFCYFCVALGILKVLGGRVNSKQPRECGTKARIRRFFTFPVNFHVLSKTKGLMYM